MKALKIAVVAAAFVLGTALASAQQQAASPPQFKGGVDLVQIDVVALDKDGHPVSGLTAADFNLSDRSKPQQIATFKEVTISGSGAAPAAGSRAVPSAEAATAPAVAGSPTPSADRIVVMVLDDFHVYRGLADRAKAIAHKIATALGPQSTIAVLFTSGHHSINFTRDAGAISAAIDAFTPTQIGRRPGPGSDTPKDPFKGDPLGPPPPYDEKRDVALFYADEALPQTIDDAARLLLTTDARRKAFVLISESTAANFKGFFNGKFGCKAPCQYRTAMENAVESMERAAITLYAFDPRGAVADADIARECAPGRPGPLLRDPCVGDIIRNPESNWIRNAETGLQLTTEATGGFAVTNTDDFDAGVNRLLQEIDHYYLLGFSPSDRKGNGFRPVTVTTTHPGITLHYRRGYVLGGGLPRP
jgi:VWFA-related protein